MTVRCSKLTKKIEFSKKDYIVIRPITHEEMAISRECIKNSSIMGKFLEEMKKLLDRDPNEKVNETFKEQIEKMNELQESEGDNLKKYYENMVDCSIHKIVDENEEIKDKHKYLKDLRSDCYEILLGEIISLNTPDKERIDFLAKRLGSSAGQEKEILKKK